MSAASSNCVNIPGKSKSFEETIGLANRKIYQIKMKKYGLEEDLILPLTFSNENKSPNGQTNPVLLHNEEECPSKCENSKTNLSLFGEEINPVNIFKNKLKSNFKLAKIKL